MQALRVGLIAAVLVFATAVAAQKQMTGKPAPDFDAGDCANAPPEKTLAACKGDVVLIMYWSIYNARRETNAWSSNKAFPEIQELWDKYSGLGLQVFMIEGSKADKEELKDFAAEYGFTMPLVVRVDKTTSNFSEYEVGRVPYAYVIGASGEVVWQGKQGYEDTIEEELKKVVYPGLARTSVHEKLEKAAEAFGEGDYGKAASLAEKAKNKHGDTEEAVKDADYILNRIEKRAVALRAVIDADKTARRYRSAIRHLERMAERYAKLKHGEDAEDEVKELKKDKGVKAELAAWEDLDVILAENRKTPNKDQKKERLREFIERNKDKAAAEQARRHLNRLNE